MIKYQAQIARKFGWSSPPKVILVECIVYRFPLHRPSYGTILLAPPVFCSSSSSFVPDLWRPVSHFNSSVTHVDGLTISEQNDPVIWPFHASLHDFLTNHNILHGFRRSLFRSSIELDYNHPELCGDDIRLLCIS
jgi:hypothetical protein